MADMEMERFCAGSRVVIVAGKGGVGKTTVTAALAVAAAATGLSVLIVEVEGKSGLATCFGAPPLEYLDAGLSDGVRGRTLTPDRALVEYLEDRGLRRISKRLVRSGALDVVATAVPGMKDILVLGKVKQLEQGRAADLILVDAPAAGHAVSFLMSPRGLLDAVRVGPVRTQAEDVIAMLSDPARCRVMLVTLPEETPVNELVDTAFALEDRVGVQLGPVVVNAMPEELALAGSTAADDAATAGVHLRTVEVAALERAAGFEQERHALAVTHADRLAAKLPLPQLRLPFVFGEIGPAEIDHLASAVAGEVAHLTDPGS
jgi:anion-transporting  ArsA/GET3 family ATPase